MYENLLYVCVLYEFCYEDGSVFCDGNYVFIIEVIVLFVDVGFLYVDVVYDVVIVL